MPLDPHLLEEYWREIEPTLPRDADLKDRAEIAVEYMKKKINTLIYRPHVQHALSQRRLPKIVETTCITRDAILQLVHLHYLAFHNPPQSTIRYRPAEIIIDQQGVRFTITPNGQAFTDAVDLYTIAAKEFGDIIRAQKAPLSLATQPDNWEQKIEKQMKFLSSHKSYGVSYAYTPLTKIHPLLKDYVLYMMPLPQDGHQYLCRLLLVSTKNLGKLSTDQNLQDISKTEIQNDRFKFSTPTNALDIFLGSKGELYSPLTVESIHLKHILGDLFFPLQQRIIETYASHTLSDENYQRYGTRFLGKKKGSKRKEEKPHTPPRTQQKIKEALLKLPRVPEKEVVATTTDREQKKEGKGKEGTAYTQYVPEHRCLLRPGHFPTPEGLATAKELGLKLHVEVITEDGRFFYPRDIFFPMLEREGFSVEELIDTAISVRFQTSVIYYERNKEGEKRVRRTQRV